MTVLDWPGLRALIDAGAVGDVVTAMDGLDERQRRALVVPVRGYARTLTNDVEVGWRRRRRRIAALRVAGTGCLLGADTVARWLTRQDLWTWNDDVTAAHLSRVLQARDVPWLGELARRLAARLRTDRWDHQLWQLVAELVTSNGIQGVELPVTDGFVLGWMRAPRPDGRLANTLAADPFLEVLAPKLFEVDGAGGWFAWSASAGIPAEASWPAALAALAADGRLPRAVLLDRCLGRLLRGGRPTELRGFLLLLRALDPDLEEVAARARDYCRLLADGPSVVARAAQRALRRLDDAGRLEPDLLVDASRAVLFRSEKTLVRTQLTWLDAAARRHPDRAAELLCVVSVAFAQEAAELQACALALLVRHARHADPAARVELLAAAVALPADLRQQAAAALNGQVADPPTSWPVLLPPTPRELPPPIATPAELAEELAAFFEGSSAGVEPVALERLLAALVAFAHRDRAGLSQALEPVLARHRIPSWLPILPTQNHVLLHESQQLSWAVMAAVTPTTRGRLLRAAMAAMWDAGGGNHRLHRARLPAPGPRLAMLHRLHEIAAGLWRPPPLLLATPTTATGHLDPAELVVRLQQTADGGWEPWAYDLEQALLRLPRAPDPAALTRARRLPTPAGRRLATWLADGGLPDPEVTRVARTVRGRPRWLPDGQPAAGGRMRVFATVTPGSGPAGPLARPTPLGILHRLRPQRPPLAGLLCQLAEPEHRGLWDLGDWLGCWSALLPSHRDVIAAHLLPRLAQLPRGARGGGWVLPGLAEADGPAGPGLTLGLAYGLGARDPLDRAAAVDALVILAGRRQLDGSALGAELGRLVGLDLLQVGRMLPALRDLARSGAPGEVWAILATAIPGLLPPAVERAPRGLPDLLALGAELASAIGGCHAIPELAAITGRGGSSRLVAESRRLQQLLA